MVLRCAVLSVFYKQVGVLIIICNIVTCSSIVLPQTFETCGIFVNDSQPISNQQADFLQDIIEDLLLNHKNSRSLMIKNNLSQRDVHPHIFRSMKYDCFLYVHINFGNDLFSMIPPFDTPIQSALYQKALFLIVINRNPAEVCPSKSAYSQLNRQYSVFVFRIIITGRYIQLRVKPFLFYQRYFFCSFWEGFILIKRMNSNYLSLRLSSFEKHWGYSDHYYGVSDQIGRHAKFCLHKNALYFYRINIVCEAYIMVIQMVALASGHNLTTIPYKSNYFHLNLIPQIVLNEQYTRYRDPFKYSPPVLNQLKYPSVIYCLNLRKKTVAEANMWTKYVPVNVWGLVGLILVLLTVLNTTKASYTMSLKCMFRNFMLFVNSFLRIMGIILRQSWSHKWKLLGVLELLFSTFISINENCITVSVVVPLFPRPLTTIKELYNNNYTFVVQKYDLYRVQTWLYSEYNTTNHEKVISVAHFIFLNDWLERFFINHHNDKKYAIVGHLTKNLHYLSVKLVNDRNGTCYHLFPPEKAFYPEAFYFHFASAVASSLQKGVLMLQTAGLLRVFETAYDFRDNLIAKRFVRPLAAKYGNEISHAHLQHIKLQENMITLGNIKSGLHAGLIVILSASVAFVAEVCMFNHISIRKKAKVWVKSGSEMLVYITKVAKRNFNCWQFLLCSLWFRVVPLKFKKQKILQNNKVPKITHVVSLN